MSTNTISKTPPAVLCAGRAIPTDYEQRIWNIFRLSHEYPVSTLAVMFNADESWIQKVITNVDTAWTRRKEEARKAQETIDNRTAAGARRRAETEAKKKAEAEAQWSAHEAWRKQFVEVAQSGRDSSFNEEEEEEEETFTNRKLNFDPCVDVEFINGSTMRSYLRTYEFSSEYFSFT